MATVVGYVCFAHSVSPGVLHPAHTADRKQCSKEVAYIVIRTNKKTKTRMAVAGGAMAAMLALGAGPATADEADFDTFDGDDAVEEVEFEDGALEVEFADGGDLDLEGIDGEFLDFSDGGGFDVDSDTDVDTDTNVDGFDVDSDTDVGTDTDVDSGGSNSVDID